MTLPLLLVVIAAAIAPPRNITLAEAVRIAIENNRDVRTAKLRRDSADYDLYLARGRFAPQLTIGPFLDRGSLNNDALGLSTKTEQQRLGVSSDLSLLLPTGARLSAEYEGLANNDRSPGTSLRSANDVRGFRMTQPLLRDGGLRANLAPLRIAELSNAIGAEDARAVAIRVVTSTVFAYRNLIRAREQVEIVKMSLANSREVLEISKNLVEAGRMAPAELVQGEADIAAKELNVLLAENDLESARVELLALLDIDTRAVLVPTEELKVEITELDETALLKDALEKRPEAVQARLGEGIGDQQVAIARNRRLLGLDFDMQYSGDSNFIGSRRLPVSTFDARDRLWRTGLSLNYTFGDRSRTQQYAQARLDAEIARTARREVTDNVTLEVHDAVRTVRLRQRQVELARAARGLTEKKLEIEREKLKAGRSSSFQVSSYEDDLVGAKSAELAATIAYLNARTQLDQTVGRTLEAWGVKIDDK
jgi:outer membrane protein TolC